MLDFLCQRHLVVFISQLYRIIFDRFSVNGTMESPLLSGRYSIYYPEGYTGNGGVYLGLQGGKLGLLSCPAQIHIALIS